MNLDYSPLTAPVSEHDIEQAKVFEQSAGNKTTRVLTITIFILFGFFFLLMAIMQFVANGTLDPLFIAIVLFAAGMIIWSRVSAKKYRKKLARLNKFALANNLRFTANTPNPGYPGMIFDEGHTRFIIEAFSFPDGSEIGNYKYETGSGKNRSSHYWAYLRVKLTRNLPHMVLDAKSNNLFGKFSNLPDSFNKDQQLTLEGDFNDHFTLYAPKEYEHDALYVFTPDVMAAVLDSGRGYEMEVVDDNLMFYAPVPFALDSEAQLKQALAMMSHIGTELRDQTDYYKDDRTVTRAENVVAEPGKRLKTKLATGALIIFAIYIIYWILEIVKDIVLKQ